MINFKDLNISNIYNGQTEASAVYLGSTKIYPDSSTTPPQPDGPEIIDGDGIMVITQQETVAGDVLFYNPNTDKLVFGRFVDTNSDYQYNDLTPIGIVTVPASHNIYGDNSCACLSLEQYRKAVCDNYDLDKDSRSKFNAILKCDLNNDFVEMYEGNYSGSISRRHSVTQSSRSNKLLYDIGYSESVNHTPSPYNDGMLNNWYLQETIEDQPNILNDFDGFTNTQLIKNLAPPENWNTVMDLTSDEILDNNLFVPPIICLVYNTIGTVAGDWYWPTLAEMIYAMSRDEDVEVSRQNIESNYGINTDNLDTLSNYFIVNNANINGSNNSTSWAIQGPDNGGWMECESSNFYSDYYIRPYIRILPNNTPVHGEVQGGEMMN